MATITTNTGKPGLWRTVDVILSYPCLFKPKARKDKKGNPLEYGGAFLYTAETWDAPDTKALRDAVNQAGVDAWGADQFAAFIREERFESPWRKDISAKKYPAHVVRYFTAGSGEQYPPGVFLRELEPGSNPPRPKKATDPRQFYAGAIVRASVTIRCYGGRPGDTYKPGIKLDLANVQWIKDGDRLSAAGGGGDGSEFDGLPPAPAADPNAGGSPLAGLLD